MLTHPLPNLRATQEPNLWVLNATKHSSTLLNDWNTVKCLGDRKVETPP